MHTLEELRTALGLSVSDFAKSIGVTRGRISQIEQRMVGGRQVRPPRLGHASLLRCAELYRKQMIQLGITVEDLIRGTRERPATDDTAATGS